MNLVLIGIIILVVFIMLNASRYQNFQILGVTFSAQHANSPQIQSLQAKFKYMQLTLAIIFMALSYISKLDIFKGYRDFTQLSFLFLYLISSYIGLTFFQKKLVNLKIRENWVYESHIRMADLSVAREKGKAAPSKNYVWILWAINCLPFFLAFLKGMSWPVLIPLFIVGLVLIIIPLSYPHAIRIRTPFVAEQTEITQSYMRRYERISGISYIQIMILMTAFFIVTTLLMLFDLSSDWFIMILLLFVSALIGLVFYSSRKHKELQNEYFSVPAWHLNESKARYKWGAYYDPDDPRIFVPKISGTGMTINIGRPAGKIIHLVMLILILVLLIVVFIMSTTNFDIVVDSNQLQIQAPFYGVEVDFDQIQEIELSKQDLSGIRTNGFGGQEKSFGFFNLENYGSTRLFVYNDQPSHISLLLEEGNEPQWLIFNQSTAEETENLYIELKNNWELR